MANPDGDEAIACMVATLRLVLRERGGIHSTLVARKLKLQGSQRKQRARLSWCCCVVLL